MSKGGKERDRDREMERGGGRDEYGVQRGEKQQENEPQTKAGAYCSSWTWAPEASAATALFCGNRLAGPAKRGQRRERKDTRGKAGVRKIPPPTKKRERDRDRDREGGEEKSTVSKGKEREIERERGGGEEKSTVSKGQKEKRDR